ncbi:hypothetical protein MN608_07521 [Microdochium nivale]|nr:hypothetical protein MN608_07521 [Microdochium nivale]
MFAIDQQVEQTFVETLAAPRQVFDPARPPKPCPEQTRKREQDLVLRDKAGPGSALDMALDFISYVDLLMNDIGLKARRKGSMLAEVFQAYKPGDYAGVLNEYWALHGI